MASENNIEGAPQVQLHGHSFSIAPDAILPEAAHEKDGFGTATDANTRSETIKIFRNCFPSNAIATLPLKRLIVSHECDFSSERAWRTIKCCSSGIRARMLKLRPGKASLTDSLTAQAPFGDVPIWPKVGERSS
jgi:hypothetical protein